MTVIDINDKLEDKKAEIDFFKLYDKFVKAEETDLLAFMHLTDIATDFLALKVLKIKANDSQFLEKLAQNEVYKLLNDTQEMYLKMYVFED